MLVGVYKCGLEHAIATKAVDLYRESHETNVSCARAIEKAIQESNHALYRYDLVTASKAVIVEYGAERVRWVLAATLQEAAHDGRFSDENKDWSKEVPIPQGRKVDLSEYTVATHPAVLDGFVRVIRKIFAEQEHSKKAKGPEREERSR